MFKIFIADHDEEYCRTVAAYLTTVDDMRVVDWVTDQAQILQRLLTVSADVLLFDPLKPDGSGVDVLEYLRDHPIGRPQTIVTTVVGDDDFVARASQLGVDYYLVKPFSLTLLEERIRFVVYALSAAYGFGSEVIRQRIARRTVNYFARLGVPAHFKGHRYLVEATTLVALDSNWLHGVTTGLYPTVARRFNTSAMQVERTIRHAIEITWQRGNLRELNRVFAHSVDADKGKPTNSSFIAKMANTVNLEAGYGHD